MYANGGIPLKYASDGSVAVVSEPRPTQVFDGKEYVSKLIRFLWAVISIPVHPENCSTISENCFRWQIVEYALRPDISLVKAFKADTRGNLIFRGTSQNANPDCAVAGKVVLVSD